MITLEQFRNMNPGDKFYYCWDWTTGYRDKIGQYVYCCTFLNMSEMKVWAKKKEDTILPLVNYKYDDFDYGAECVDDHLVVDGKVERCFMTKAEAREFLIDDFKKTAAALEKTIKSLEKEIMAEAGKKK